MARTALVTGANRGIGLALCRRLRSGGREVIGVCRKSSPALDALGVRVEAGVDVTSDDAVAGLARRLAGVALDELICNAGILREDGLDDAASTTSARSWRSTRSRPLRVVAALRQNLRRGGKIAPHHQPHGIDRRQRLGRLLRLPHVEGGAERGRHVAGARSRVVGRRRRDPAPGLRAHRHDRGQPATSIPPTRPSSSSIASTRSRPRRRGRSGTRTARSCPGRRPWCPRCASAAAADTGAA